LGFKVIGDLARRQAAFFAARFFVPEDLTADAALLTAQRRFIASASRSRPSGVIRTLRAAALRGAALLVPSAARFAAHRFLNAAESLFRPSGVIPPVRFAGLAEDFAAVAGAEAEVPSTSRNAASARSIAAACCSSWAIMSSNPFAMGFPLSSICTN
jgi:hypothetical protein